MLQNGFLGGVLSALPNIKLSDLPNIDVSGKGMVAGMTPPTGGNPKKTPTLPQDAASKFGNWLNTTDTKQMAADLMKRNLEGANQLVFENQDTSSADAIKNKNQSDWKIAAIQGMLGNAYRLGIKTPEEVTANWNVLTNGKFKDAINDPTFSVIHSNFPDVFKKLLADQWAKQNQNQIASK